MFNANQYVKDFDGMEMLKFALNFRTLGNLDVKVLKYLCSLPAETLSEVSDVRIFRGGYSELARAIRYDDQCNVRKAVMRLEDIGVLTTTKGNNRRITTIILNKYWMLKIRDLEN